MSPSLSTILGRFCLLGLASAVFASAAHSVHGSIQSGLSGHWKLDETDPADLQVLNSAPVGSPEHGTRSAGVEIGHPTPVGTGYFLNGLERDDFVTMGTTYVDQLRATNQFTISGWINPDFIRPGSGSGSRQMIVAANTQFQFGLQDEGNFFYTFMRGGSAQTLVFSIPDPLRAGDFSHVALVHHSDPDGFGDDGIYLYVDGERVGEEFSFPGLDAFSISGNTLFLGRIEGNTSQDFDGMMTDFGLWVDRPLTRREVAMVGGMGRAGMPLSSTETDAVLALFDSGTGTVTTGDWEWSRTTAFAPSPGGADLALGKHYYGTDNNIYVVLGGSDGAWEGVMATGGDPFILPIIITRQPDNQDVPTGGTAVFEVEVDATGPVEHQWFYRFPGLEPEAIEGANASVFTVANAQVEDRGFYSCRVSLVDGDFSVTTREARLSLTDGPTLIAHWTLDELDPDLFEVVNSAPGARIHGERTPEVRINQFGLIKGAHGYSSGSFVNTGYNGWVPATGDFSVFAWIKTDNPHSTQGHVFSNNQGDFGRSSLHVENGVARYFLGGPPNLSIAGTSVVTDGEWNHIGVTRSGDNFTLWVNGVAQANGISSTPVAHGADWSIGRRGQPGGGFPFDGLVDDVGVWHRALSPAEVAVKGGLGRIGQPLSMEEETAAIAAAHAAQSGTVITGDWTWRFTTSFAAPADGSELSLGKHYVGGDGNVYVVLGGGGGAWDGVVAEGGVLVTDPPIIITVEPEDQFTATGGTVEFTVTAESSGPVSYQWFYLETPVSIGTLIDGATSALLQIENADLSDEGLYFCRVSQTDGDFWVQSRNASLLMTDRPVSLLHHWLLDETAGDLPELNPGFVPAEDRQTEGSLVNQVEGGHEALLIKGQSVEAPAPVYAAASPSPYSTGSIGLDFREGYIALGQVAPESNAYTMAFWFKRTPGRPFAAGEVHLMQSNAGGSQDNRWGFRVRNGNDATGTFLLDLWQHGASTVVLDSEMESDRWYHVALTRDLLDNFKIYLDGGEIHSSVRSIPLTNAPGGVFLGNDPHLSESDFPRYFPGTYDDVRFYDGALSATQVLRLLEEGVFEITITHEPEDQLVNQGEAAEFAVGVTADGPVDYQWFFQAGSGVSPVELSGQNGPVLVIANAGLADRGLYFCVISEAGGDFSVPTRQARLRILDGPALVGHWKLDETDTGSLEAFNSAPGANVHGERTADALIGQDGIVDGAYAFSEEAHVNTRSNDWVPETGDFSVFAWVKTDNPHSTQGHVFSNNQGGVGRSSLHVLSGTARYFLGGPPNLSLASSTVVTDGGWHHIGVTRVGENITLWVNGVAEAAGVSSVAVQHGFDWAIGRRGQPTGGFPFDGSIDDVGVWHRALTPGQVGVTGGLGRTGQPLSMEGTAQDILAVFDARSGTVLAGGWAWRFTDSPDSPATGGDLSLGRHYLGTDGNVYVILGGEAGAWEGVMAGPVDFEGYADWVALQFTPEEAANEAVSGPFASAGGDGLPNLVKYAFGLNPKVPAPMEELPELVADAEGLTLSFNRLKNGADVTYIIEFSTNLTDWEPANTQETGVDDRGDVERVTVRATGLPGGLPGGFLRVRLILAGS